jgi:hypothetical protein
MGRLGLFGIEDSIGAQPLRETKGVSAVKKMLAAAVLGVSLAFVSSIAFGGDVELVAQVMQPAVPGYDTEYNTVVQPSHPALQVQFPL